MSCEDMKGDGCGRQHVRSDFIIADRISAARAGLGRPVSVDFANMPGAPAGFRRYVTELRIKGVFKGVTTSAANLAITLRAFAAMFYNIKLSSYSDHYHLEGIDGRELRDFTWLENGYRAAESEDAFGQEELAANLGDAEPVEAAFCLHLPLSRERWIPLDMLKAREAEAFAFQLRSSLPFPAASGVKLTGVFQEDGTTAGLTIRAGYADIIEGRDWMPPRWGWRSYERTEKSDHFKYRNAAHLFIVARQREEDVANHPLTSIDGVNLTVAGVPTLSGLSFDEMQVRQMQDLMATPDSIGVHSGDSLNIDDNGGGSGSLLVFLPPRERRFAAAGPVEYRLEEAPSMVRILHSFVECTDVGKATRAARSIGMRGQPVQSLPSGEAVAVTRVLDRTGPVAFVDASKVRATEA